MNPATIPRAVLLLLLVAIPSVTHGVGVASNENFIVIAPDRSLAGQVAAQADAFRKQVAQEWFGEELPPGAGAAVIRVELSGTEDNGFTYAMDSPNRKRHLVWLKATRDAVTGEALYHEVVHVVFATRFPDRLPAWIEEGIAGLKDGPRRIRARQQMIQRFARTGNWPDCAGLFEAQTIPADRQASYSVAGSVTRFLLSRGDKANLLRFAVSGKQQGWDRALQRHYGLASVAHLERAWRAWASQPSRLYAQAAPTNSDRGSATTQGGR